VRKKEGLNETALIREIEKISLVTRKFNKSLIIKSIGDDCAIFKDKNNILVSTDCITENVHFTIGSYSFNEIGAKSLLVNLSDIAAMGGVPRLFTLSLLLPEYINEENIKNILHGIVDIAKKYKISLVGGNISRSSELSVSITIIGDYKDDNVIRRDGSRVGDSVFVSGELGNAWMSYYLRQHIENTRKKGTQLEDFEKQFKLPTPRIKLANELATKRLANSLTDISDGLYKDVFNIAGISNGIEIWMDELPINENLKHIVKLLKIKKYMDNVISFGEDYELLWTSDSTKEDEILNLSSRLGVMVKKIGRIVSEPAQRVFIKNGAPYAVHNFTFRHL